MLYFRGCTARERVNSISDSTEKLLKLANIDFKTLENEECCGSVLLRTGFENDAKEHMRKNLAKLKDEKIVVSCAGCYKTLKQDYKEHIGADLDVIHISQLLNDIVSNIEYDSSIDNDILVTYHDSCHLGRHSGEFDAPRDVIKIFSKIVEMENIRENSLCCGSGGGVKSAFPEIANSIASKRCEEAKNTGADILITSCPFCKLNLDENSSFLVLDLSEFVLACIEGNINKLINKVNINKLNINKLNDKKRDKLNDRKSDKLDYKETNSEHGKEVLDEKGDGL